MFFDNSYGVRLGSKAHDVVLNVKEHMSQKYKYVVDMDLEKFFDRVNHDILMDRV
ncbi:reverse transcriptase domain-containing protein [Inediibacterium massiliense]|uniref:reverse transcriptase domain-containing protein n=1 Tax=Inediibacterium massiliense TaxID=1658111 RepID=UPI003BF5A718